MRPSNGIIHTPVSPPPEFWARKGWQPLGPSRQRALVSLLGIAVAGGICGAIIAMTLHSTGPIQAQNGTVLPQPMDRVTDATQNYVALISSATGNGTDSAEVDGQDTTAPNDTRVNSCIFTRQRTR